MRPIERAIGLIRPLSITALNSWWQQTLPGHTERKVKEFSEVRHWVRFITSIANLAPISTGRGQINSQPGLKYAITTPIMLGSNLTFCSEKTLIQSIPLAEHYSERKRDKATIWVRGRQGNEDWPETLPNKQAVVIGLTRHGGSQWTETM